MKKKKKKKQINKIKIQKSCGPAEQQEICKIKMYSKCKGKKIDTKKLFTEREGINFSLML